jgi:hypothetical protein
MGACVNIRHITRGALRGLLWLYMPRAERVQKISGHMLRQGMMGG